MFTIITTLVALIFIQPPLLLLRLFCSLLLLPLRITLLPSRIFLSVVSNVVSLLWTVYGRIIQLLYNFPALIPWTLLVSVIASLTGYCLHQLNNSLYNTQYLSTPSSRTAPAPPTHNKPRSLKHHKAHPPSSRLNPNTPSPVLLIPTPTSPSPALNIPIPRSPSPSSQTTSPLLPLLPPDSPLLSRYISPTPRPTPDRNVSYRSQMRELMTERQEQLIALHEEEKRRRTLSPAGSPTLTPGQMRVGRDALMSPSMATSPLLVRQRVRSGSAGDTRPVSWPPVVVVEGGEKGARIVSGGYGRKGRLDSGTVEGGGGRGGDEYNSNGLIPSSTFPSVPRTILEEDEDDDSSELDFY